MSEAKEITRPRSITIDIFKYSFKDKLNKVKILN